MIPCTATVAEEPKADPAEIRRALDLLAPPGGIVEIRALHVPVKYGKPPTFSGYFSDLDIAAQAAAKLDAMHPAGVYIILNEINLALLARSPNTLTKHPQATTGDTDIIGRRWLPIDLDPVRPSGISSSVDEHVAAEDMARKVSAWLSGEGWPMPVLANFGERVRTFLYHIKLSNDEESLDLIRSTLAALADRFDDEAVKIDRGVFNASRIWKVYGSVARKGFDMPDRPHRLARLVNVPERIEIVSVEQLQAVVGIAAAAKQTPATPPAATANGDHRRLDVPRYLAAHGIEYRTKDRPGGRGFLVPCPFGPHGSNGESAIWQGNSGLLTFECKHASCSGRRWADYRDFIGKPTTDHYDGPPARLAPGTPEAPDKFDLGIITAAGLLRKDCRVEFYIPHILAKGQHHILGGPLKSCKTLIACDLAVALATGGMFLDYFPVARPVRTILLCGESGWPVFQENIRRISNARGATEEQLDKYLHTGVRLPKFGNASHQNAICEEIVSRKAEVVVFDCAYRAIPGDQVLNQFAMGELLDGIGNALEDVGATLVLLCHTPKHIAPGAPLELDNLAFAGLSEFAAQWLIVNRQRAYEPGSGRHYLWAVVGGRAGHTGLYSLDIDEGQFVQGQDREWRVAVAKGSDARQEQRGECEKQREAKLAEKLETNRQRICNVVAKFPGGETKTTIRDRTGLRPEIFNSAWASLFDDGILVPIEIVKPNRKKPYEGYRLRDSDIP